MPDSESRLVRVMEKVCESLAHHSQVVEAQTEAIQMMAESNQALADAINRQLDDDVEPDPAGVDLGRRDEDDEPGDDRHSPYIPSTM